MSLWAPLDTENINNPYPMYTRLREEAPIFKAQTGEWIISSYEDVKFILKDSRFISGNKLEWIKKGVKYFKNKDQDLSAIAAAMDNFLLMLNPPQHTRIRKFISAVWDNREVDLIINENIAHLFDTKSNHKNFDIVADFARPLPTMTICKIMGLTINDYEKLQTLGNSLVKAMDLYNSFKDLVIMEAAASQMIDYFQGYIAHRRKNPGHDLVSKMIIANASTDEPLTETELISLSIFLFIAGQETTIALISTGLMNLAANPAEREKILSSEELLPLAVDELLRYDSPVHLVGRIAGEDVRINQHTIQKGDTLTLCLASANRDVNQFEQPDRLDISRKQNRHLAFGSGIHFCLGDWLAKKQGALAIGEFLKKYPSYEIDQSAITWNKNLSIRTLKALTCTLQP